MPSKRTTDYQLCQWEPDDKVLRTDFNADNDKIDKALKALDTGKASSSALTSLQTKVNAKASQTELDALSAKVTQLQSALSTLQTTVEKKQDAAGAVKLKVGTYSGDGNASRSISVGFKPQAVVLYSHSGVQGYIAGGYTIYGGMAVTGGPLQLGNGSSIHPVLELTSTGFTVYQNEGISSSSNLCCNKSGTDYRYVALA